MVFSDRLDKIFNPKDVSKENMDTLEIISEDLAQAQPSTSSQIEQPIPKVITYPQPNSADYWLAYLSVAGVGVLGYLGLWLKKYSETRLELSIERQRQVFADAKEDRDRLQAQTTEDRIRAQNQADIFLTATLSAIQEEKDNQLAALERLIRTLEKVDMNQAEMMTVIIEISNRSKVWDGTDRRT
jgi:hypothetical protein